MKKVERLPVISIEAEEWESTAQGCLANIQAGIDLEQIKPKELLVVFYDRNGGNKRLVVKAVGTKQNEKFIGMLELAKSVLVDLELE